MSDIAGADEADASNSRETSAYPPSIQPGIPTLGPTPKGWTRYALGDLLRVVERPANLIDNESYQLVTAKRNRGGIVARETLRGDQVRTKTQFYVEVGDFLISNRQISHGACGLVPTGLHRAVVSNEYTVFRASNDIDPTFLRTLSNSIHFQQTCFHSSIGVHVEKLVFRLNDWLSWEFNIPPLAEQRRIVTMLGTWDRAIEKSLALIVARRRSKAALLDRLCTPLHSFKSLPAGWSRVALQDVANVRTGVAKNSKDKLRQPVKLPYLRVANVQDGYLNLSDIKEIVIEEADVPRYQIAFGDVLLTEGGDADKLGRGYVWRGEISPCLHQNHVFAVRPDQSRVLSDYLSAYCSGHSAKRYFLSCSKQTTNLASVNSSQIREMPLILPPLPEQKSIVAVLNTLDQLVAKSQNLLDCLQRQRQGLLQKLLTGEWRLNKHIGKPARSRVSVAI